MLLVGAGRIGTALRDAAAAAGDPVGVVSRDRGWELLDGPPDDPILLCVRNDDLDAVIARVPARRRADLVFAQNGALRDYLASRGLAGNTRALLYFAVAARGDGLSPGRTSWTTGPHAAATAHFLLRCGLAAEAVDWARFGGYELEKLAWLVVFGALCDRHGETVGEVAERRVPEVLALTDDVRRVGRVVMNVDLPLDWMVHRLCDYSRSIPTFRASSKEPAWRHGWVLDTAATRGVAIPALRQALERA